MSRYAWTALIAVALLVVGLMVFVGRDEDPKPKPEPDTHVAVPIGSGLEREVPKALIERVRESEVAEHAGLRAETPENVPLKDIVEGQQQQERLAETDQLPLVTPDAAPSQRGCLTRTASNKSSRRGVRPRIWVLHWTGSANRPGYDDMNAIQQMANNPATQVSWHYLIDNEGHCYYSVPESAKAWTGAGFNPVAIQAEVINTSVEPTYARTKGLNKIARVVSDSTRRWGIPLRRGRVSGCSVVRSGIVHHDSLGACGGGHPDIVNYGSGCNLARNSGGWACVDTIIRRAKALRETPAQRKRRAWTRRHARVHRRLKAECRTRRQARGAKCRSLRSKNRTYHRLLRR